MGTSKIKIFNFSEIHGSDLCFIKILKLATCKERPDYIVLFGNITGNKIIPIIKENNSSKGYLRRSMYEGKNYYFKDEEDANKFIYFLAAKGDYGYKCNPAQFKRFSYDSNERANIIKGLKIQRIKEWLKIADEALTINYSKIVIIPGTDDPYEIDKLIQNNSKITLLDKDFHKINEKTIIYGFSNSAFNFSKGIPEMFRYKFFYRNIEENQILATFHNNTELFNSVEDFNHSIFYFPFPPQKTNLDIIVNGTKIAFGSKGIREIIMRYQPKFSFHSVLFENLIDKINFTTLINPGSEYYDGRVRFEALIIDNEKIKNIHYVEDPFTNLNLPQDPENSDDIDLSYIDPLVKLLPFGKIFIAIKEYYLLNVKKNRGIGKVSNSKIKNNNDEELINNLIDEIKKDDKEISREDILEKLKRIIILKNKSDESK